MKKHVYTTFWRIALTSITPDTSQLKVGLYAKITVIHRSPGPEECPLIYFNTIVLCDEDTSSEAVTHDPFLQSVVRM